MSIDQESQGSGSAPFEQGAQANQPVIRILTNFQQIILLDDRERQDFQIL